MADRIPTLSWMFTRKASSSRWHLAVCAARRGNTAGSRITPTSLDRLLRKLSGDGVSLRFCYEAGPCGYGFNVTYRPRDTIASWSPPR
jgi:hypothetical protein